MSVVTTLDVLSREAVSFRVGFLQEPCVSCIAQNSQLRLSYRLFLTGGTLGRYRTSNTAQDQRNDQEPKHLSKLPLLKLPRGCRLLPFREHTVDAIANVALNRSVRPRTAGLR